MSGERDRQVNCPLQCSEVTATRREVQTLGKPSLNLGSMADSKSEDSQADRNGVSHILKHWVTDQLSWHRPDHSSSSVFTCLGHFYGPPSLFLPYIHPTHCYVTHIFLSFTLTHWLRCKKMYVRWKLYITTSDGRPSYVKNTHTSHIKYTHKTVLLNSRAIALLRLTLIPRPILFI